MHHATESFSTGLLLCCLGAIEDLEVVTAVAIEGTVVCKTFSGGVAGGVLYEGRSTTGTERRRGTGFLRVEEEASRVSWVC